MTTGDTSTSMRLRPDMPVDAADGHLGRLADVVVDPDSRRVTHLVVRRAHTVHPRAYLVPLATARIEEDRLRLVRTREEVEATDPVDETDFVELGGWPHGTDEWDVGIVRVVSWPSVATTGRFIETPGPADTDTMVEFDRLPRGTVEIRRESEVFSSDHAVVGHVEGLVVDDTASVTQVVVRRHHLLGHYTVRVPREDIGSITTDAVYLALTREEVDALAARAGHGG